MAALLRNTVLTACTLLLLAGICWGKEVYLKDGGIIDCQSFWKRGKVVVVKINRDTMLEFRQSEIDLKRTFKTTGKKAHHIKRKKTSRHARNHVKAAQPVIDSAPAAPAASATPPAPAPVANAVSPPAPVPVPQPEVVQPAVPAPAPEAGQPGMERNMQPAEMMAEAIKNKDPELMKQAMAAQQGAMVAAKVLSTVMSPSFMIGFFLVCLLMVVSTWVVFEKGGHAGWKSLIPIYNLYILMLVSGKPGWWFFLMFIPILNAVFYLLAMLGMAERFGRGPLFGLGLFFLPILFFPLLAFGGRK